MHGLFFFLTISVTFLFSYLTSACLKFNIPEGRQLDMKVFDQSDTEVDAEVFEEIVKGSPVTFRVMLSNEELGNHSHTYMFI